MKDQIDEHVALWTRELPGLDQRREGIVTRMQHLVKYLARTKAQAFADHGLAPWEFQTLHDLRRRGTPYQATPTELAGALELSPAAMTKRLDTMERSGYVRRRHDSGDRRRVVVTLTDAGHRAWKSTMRDQDEVEHALFGALSAAQQEQLNNLLRHLVRAAGRAES